MNTAIDWINQLELEKHPEGGYFKEVYRSDEHVIKKALPSRYIGDRSFSTSIYFLLKDRDFSCFHRLQTDEIWHFYQGTTLEIFVLHQKEGLSRHLMGQQAGAGEHLQITILRDQWFAARVVEPNSFSLVGCTMAPGFDFHDFELANRKQLISEFPQYSQLIKELTIE